MALAETFLTPIPSLHFHCPHPLTSHQEGCKGLSASFSFLLLHSTPVEPTTYLLSHIPQYPISACSTASRVSYSLFLVLYFSISALCWCFFPLSQTLPVRANPASFFWAHFIATSPLTSFLVLPLPSPGGVNPHASEACLMSLTRLGSHIAVRKGITFNLVSLSFSVAV